MTTSTIMTCIIWGTVAGLLGSQLLANLMALLFCLHGLLMTRWKRLAKKVTGQIKYSINLQLAFKVGLYALLFAALLRFGDSYIQREFWFEYRGNALILFTITCTLAAFALLPVSIRRLRVIWRISHEFDYAERRQRTRMLRS